MQNSAVLLVLSGVLLLYCEGIWIGKIYFGVAGALLLILGLYAGWPLPHTNFGIALILAAIAGFLLEAALKTYFLAGIGATVLLGVGFWKLTAAPFELATQLAFPACAVFGIITTALCHVAKKARKNKRFDL